MMFESDQKQTEADLRFLAEASTLLATSRNVEATMQQIAALAVPRIADWCVIYGLADDGAVERRAIEVADASQRNLARRLQAYPLGDRDPVRVALRSGAPQLIREVSDDDLRAVANSEEHLALIRELKLRSFMVVPMVARQQAVGAIAFSISQSARRYSERDLFLAADLGRSAGIAFDNARLYEEQGRTEKALRESISRSQRQLSELSAIYATAPVGLCFVDPSCRYMSVNEAMADMNDLAAEEHVGRRFIDVLPDALANELEAVCLEVLASGVPVFNREFSRPAPETGGDPRFRLISFYPVSGGEDAPFGVNMVVQDITARKEWELDQQFLGEMDGKLRQLADPEPIVWEAVRSLGKHLKLSFCTFADVDLAQDGITLHEDWSGDGQSVAGRYKLSEYLPSDFIAEAQAGRTISLRDTATDRRTEALYEARRIPLGVRAFFMVPYLRDGQWVALLIGAADRPRTWRPREIQLVEAVATRVWTAVERARAEEAMRESERRFRATFEQAAVGMSHVALDGTWLRVNQRLCEIVGCTRQELLQKTFQDITHPDDLQEDLRNLRRLLAGQIQSYQMEKRYFRQSGGVVWALLTVSMVRDSATGEPEYLIAVVEEISDRKRYETELKALNETLEQRVEERTRQVRVLASELTLAEQRERRRIARVLHDDIQQMLYGLQLTIELLSPSLSANEQAAVESQLQEMRSLIGQIIDANRRLTVELSPPVLKAERLDEAFEWLIAHLAEDYGLQVELIVDDDCQVPDDDLRELIFQLVRELLLNVVRHAGVQQARLYLFEEDDMLVTRVEDDGVGFDVETVMSAQAGFGLYSVQERLDLFGGQMEIESGPGRGTQITVSVPLHPANLPGGP